MSWRAAEREYEDEVIGDTSVPRMFENSAARHQERDAQLYKGGVYERSLVGNALLEAPTADFGAIPYGEMRAIVRPLAAGFRDLGMEKGDRVAIFAGTRMEWALVDLALLAAGGVVTTVYSNSSPQMIRYLLSDAGASGVIVENDDGLERVVSVEDDLDLEFIVGMDRIGPPYADRKDVGTLGDLYERGTGVFDRATYESWIDEIELEDLATLIYTSGTTGRPKGVKLTHGNIRANINQIRKRYGPRPDKDPADPTIDVDTRTVSFLPLAHIFERTAGHFSMFAAGGCVAYAESAETLKEDFQLVRPNTATSVPRVYEKIYAAIREQAQESAFKERVFDWAVGVGVAYHQTEQPGTRLRMKRKIADRLVFGKVKDALGGNVEMLISGGGSLSRDLCALYHGMGLPIYEGYGLTETAPVVTCNPIERPQIGTIGPPLVDLEYTLDLSVVSEDDFASVEGDVGELLVKGPNVTAGYWKKPEETAAAFTDEGWFRTGDIVTVRPDEYVVFLERAKEIIVLSTGKSVAPGPIEDAFASSEIIEQCMVVGDDEKFVGALIVPALNGIRSWAEAEGVSVPADPIAMCHDERVRVRVQEEVDRVNAKFEEHETIKQFRIVPDEFTEENDLLTPTMKKKRRNIVDTFAAEIAAIYEADAPERATAT